MTKEEAIMVLKNEQPHCGKKVLFPEEKKYEAYDVAIEALEQEPCDDCISRQAVEKITWEEPSYTDALNVLTEVRDKVRALPSVNPQEPVLDKIRAEIMQLDYDTDYVDYDSNDMPQTETVHTICREEVLQIIDKYKAESEDKE